MACTRFTMAVQPKAVTTNRKVIVNIFNLGCTVISFSVFLIHMIMYLVCVDSDMCEKKSYTAYMERAQYLMVLLLLRETSMIMLHGIDAI